MLLAAEMVFALVAAPRAAVAAKVQGWGSQEGPRRGKSSHAGGSARLGETLPVRAESSFPGVSFGFTRFEIPTSLPWESNANSTKRTTSNARKAQWDRLAGLFFFFPTHPVACRAPAQTHGHTHSCANTLMPVLTHANIL